MAAQYELPKGPGREIVYARCRVCHDLQYVIESAGMDRTGWDGLLYSMEEFGVVLKDDERQKILDYLATYLGPNPPPAASEQAAAETAPEETIADGATLYADTCTECHQDDGSGVPDNFPPLAQNPDLFLAHDFPVKVVLNGLRGRITVRGGVYNGEMPPFDYLEDEAVARIINYVRSHFGNEKLAPEGEKVLTADEVAAVRKAPMDPEAVAAYRRSLGGK